MAKLVLLLVAIAFTQGAWSLKCYNCVTNTNNMDCEEVKNVGEINCNIGNNLGTGSCLKKIELDTSTKKEYITRSCINAKDKETICKPRTLQNQHFETKSCEICDNDLCNSAPSASLGLISVFGGLVSLFIVKYVLY